MSNVRHALRPDGSSSGPLSMVPLSDYRRRRNLARNIQIEKRCSRKLELNAGWSDQTEVLYLFPQLINYYRRNISERCRMHIGVSEILRLQNHQAMSRQTRILSFRPLIPCHLRLQLVLAEVCLVIVNDMDVMVGSILIERLHRMRNINSKGINSRRCYKILFWKNDGNSIHGYPKMRSQLS